MIAGVYDALAAPVLGRLRSAITREVTRAANDWAEPDSTAHVLDMGCGTGKQVALLREAGVCAVGVDLSEAMLVQAHTAGVPAAQARMERLPFSDGSFACVTLTLAIHENAPAVQHVLLTEAVRVLAPDGTLVVADWAVPRGLLAHALAPLVHMVERLAGREHYRGFRYYVAAGGAEATARYAHALSRSATADNGAALSATPDPPEFSVQRVLGGTIAVVCVKLNTRSSPSTSIPTHSG